MTNDHADADRSNDEPQTPAVSPVPRSRFADRDAVTAAERDRPPVDDTALLDLEEDAVREAGRTKPSQLALALETEPKGTYRPEISGLAPLDAGSSL
ncbi:MAG TPA: hypothetical protein VNZ55_12710, partial [Thermomicrobiales bacterium]|nr:hypothetical protein [Thermomicrobiales bacterium]